MMNVEKRKRKEAAELSRWKKQSLKKEIPGYLFLMVIVLGIVRMLDEFVSSAPTSVQSNIVQEFFVDGMGMTFETGLAMLSLITTALLVFSIAAVFFVALCDKVGRRIILIVCTIGMTLGMLLCAISSNIVVHIIGRALITFFVATDVHQVYIMEIAPDNKRAFYIQITTVFGQIGVMLVGVVRMLFTNGGELNWRGVFWLPSIVGIFATVFVILVARETKVFLKSRIAFLEKPLEQRQAEAERAKEEKREQETVSGIIPAARYVFTHRQTRNLFFANIPVSFATMTFATYYETIMTSSGMGAQAVSIVLIICPLVSALLALGIGYVMDAFGRKPAGVMTSVIAFVSLILFIYTAEHGGNPYIVGIVLGLELGCFWRYGEILGLSMKESVPTAVRTSSGAVIGLITVVISIVSGIVLSVLLAFFPVNMVCLVWGAVTLGTSAVIFITCVKETKGVSLEEIQ